MLNRIHIRNLLCCFLALTVLFSVSIVSQADDTVSSFEQSVPFGVAHNDNGEDIPVYRKPSTSRESGVLHDYQICAIVSTEKLGGTTWYRINYFDDSGAEVSGYVMGEGFYQLTVAGLVSVASDPNIVAYLQSFSGMDMSLTFVSPDETVTRSNTAASAERPAETPAPQTASYVLNTHTMKFHLPHCPSVDDIKPSNRKDFTGTREEVINMGYNPCGRCHP